MFNYRFSFKAKDLNSDTASIEALFYEADNKLAELKINVDKPGPGHLADGGVGLREMEELQRSKNIKRAEMGTHLIMLSLQKSKSPLQSRSKIKSGQNSTFAIVWRMFLSGSLVVNQNSVFQMKFGGEIPLLS